MRPGLRRAAVLVPALAALLGAGGPGQAQAAGPPPAPRRDTVELRLRPRAGQVFNRKVNVSQSLSLGGRGQQAQLIKRSLALALTFRVTEANASGAVVEGTYRGLVYMQTDLTGSVTWDSANPTEPVPRAIRDLAPLMGKTFRMRITPDGRLGEIEGVDGNVAQNLMLIYPDGPVGPGDAWSRRLDLTGETGVQVFGTFTLTGRRDGTALIDVRAALKQGAGSVPLDIGSVAMGLGVEGTLDGPLEVEEASGWAVRAKLGYRFSGQVELGAEYQLPFTVAAPFTGEGTVTLEPF